ncbi:uncharacterized protein K02A2.6-like [Solanum pennellii]|uniref:Uncharacterized protein K02A2.6-like n=1 Tax=Solanum pennellii TaxID=28526 RepID=A0ABM1GSZ9_SOLPN|nr:uncharacterized protein K02A2.6-like [Solanum pennellii]
MSSLCPFAAWGMDFIGPIYRAASNGHKFILVAIDYFKKWVEAVSYKVVTKKVMADFVCNNLICHFGVPKSIITDNGENLDSHLMKEICEQFKITHRNSTAYRSQMNGVVEAANKKDIEKNSYRTTILTSNKATPYILVYGTAAVILAEVEIPSLRIIQKDGLNDVKWVRRIKELLKIMGQGARQLEDINAD